MFGWLKSLFGSAEVITPPAQPVKAPKVKKEIKKPAVKAAKTKVSKKKEAVVEVVTPPADSAPVVVPAPKKKGGRPKKTV
jgi:hypothetical protein